MTRDPWSCSWLQKGWWLLALVLLSLCCPSVGLTNSNWWVTLTVFLPFPYRLCLKCTLRAGKNTGRLPVSIFKETVVLLLCVLPVIRHQQAMFDCTDQVSVIIWDILQARREEDVRMKSARWLLDTWSAAGMNISPVAQPSQRAVASVSEGSSPVAHAHEIVVCSCICFCLGSRFPGAWVSASFFFSFFFICCCHWIIYVDVQLERPGKGVRMFGSKWGKKRGES